MCEAFYVFTVIIKLLRTFLHYSCNKMLDFGIDTELMRGSTIFYIYQQWTRRDKVAL